MSKPINPVEKFIVRYSLVILITLASFVLGASVYLSYNILMSSSDPSNAEIKEGVSSNFDKQTREKIDKLHTSDDPNVSITLPTGRINPFSE